MKKIHTLFVLAASLSACFAASAFAQTPASAPAPAAPAAAAAPATSGDAKAGRQKALAICSGCHGVNGTKTAFPEVYHVPKLGGQSAAYIVSALKAYRAGDRYNPTMKALATALTDKEMADIAAYYADPTMGRVTSR